MNSKHIPVRQCIVCGNKFEKKYLLRVCKIDNDIVFDSSSKSGGRGAYICKSADCFDKLHSKRRLDRAFRRSVDNSVYEKILKEIDQM